MATGSERGRRRPAWLSKRSARLRLTLMFSAMFLLLGTAVIVGILLLAKSGGSSVAVSPAPAAKQVVPPVPWLVPAVGAVTAVRRGIPVHDIVIAQQRQDFSRLLAVSWVVLLITTLGATVLGWFVAGRVLRPLREMAATARTITAGSLHERLAVAGPNDEFKRLGDAFDDLLARLEAAFDAQRRFVANASHELRTPLTVERTLLQVALANPDATESSLRAAGEELLAAQVDHERLLEALLTLASSERGLEHPEAIELAELADDALESVRTAVAARGLVLERRLEPAPGVGDEVLLTRLIANLIDNAIDHNVDAGWLAVQTGSENGHALIQVANGGHPIAPAEVARLFEPFQRLEGRGGRANGSGHHGLGLSIVRAIATIHGGEVAAEAHAGGGLAVTVRLPAMPGVSDSQRRAGGSP